MRLLPLLGASVLAAAAAASALAWAGRPASPAPKPAQAAGPPAAWLESATRSSWLDFGSYCWRTGCADYLPPAQRPGLRVFKTRIGAKLRIHLAYLPKTVSLRVLPAKTLTPATAARTLGFTVRKLGILEVQVKAAPGSASYLIELRRA